MLRSMTGFGAGRAPWGSGQVAVEARSVNGRFLKVAARLPAELAALEVPLEALARAALRRGSVTLTVSLEGEGVGAAPLPQVNEAALRHYRDTCERLGLPNVGLLALPGVIEARPRAACDAACEAAVRAAATQALGELDAMRTREGAALHAVLAALCGRIEGAAVELRGGAGTVVEAYRGRLSARIGALLAAQQVPLDAAALAHEVALYADRCDITEELDRLDVHLRQVRALLGSDDEVGRTCEFLAQELHREVNTVGSKSSDAHLAHLVVALKGDIERFKEQACNVL